MIIESQAREGIYGNLSVDIKYFGKDAENFLRKLRFDTQFLNKECITKKGKGIIIGIEDSESLDDYYYIIYCPKEDKITYELINDAQFIKNVII